MGMEDSNPMMEVYLDKDFIMNFWSVSEEEKIIDDFKDSFLKKSKNFCLKTNFVSFEEISGNDEYRTFMEMLFERIPPLEFSVIQQKSEWLNNKLLNRGGYKIFLIELEQKECEKYTQETGFEFICTSNLTNCWKKYMTKEIRKSLLNQGKDEDPDVLTSWKNLAFIRQYPVNSIIIVDRYILEDTYRQEIKENLFPMLEAIIPLEKCATIDILIIAENISENLFKRINQHFAKYQTKSFIKFTLVKWDKIFMGAQTLHDRHIYSNYFTIYSGPGFNLFRKNKLRPQGDGEFDIRFIFSEFNMKVYPYRLAFLKKYLSNCKRIEVLKMKKFYPDEIHCTLLS